MNFNAKNLEATIDVREQSNELLFGTTYEIVEQLYRSFEAYESMVDFINQSKNIKDQILPAETYQFNREFSQWLEEDEGRLLYIHQAMQADPELSFTLVGTPNVALTHTQQKEVAKKFGNNQRFPTYVWDGLHDQYNPKLLCGGIDDGNAILFSLIPNKLTDDMYGTVEEQQAKLKKKQSNVETAFLRVPSLLETVAYWNTLRFQGDILEGSDNFEKTYIRHFNLPKQHISNSLCVPRSYIDSDSEPYLTYSVARFGDHARLAVG